MQGKLVRCEGYGPCRCRWRLQQSGLKFKEYFRLINLFVHASNGLQSLFAGEMEPCEGTFDLKPPYYSNQRGIVISLSGTRQRDIELTTANIHLIRSHFGSSIPVELWFHGDAESYSGRLREELCQLGIG